MADSTISGLTDISTAVARTDYLVVDDVSAGVSKKMLHSALCYVPSFTAVISDAATAGNNSPTSAFVNECLVIGRMMFVRVVFNNVDTTDMTAGNDVFITGLPQTLSAGSQIGSGGITSSSLSGNTNSFFTGSSTYINIAEFSTSGASIDNVIVSDLTSGASDIYVNAVVSIV